MLDNNKHFHSLVEWAWIENSIVFSMTQQQKINTTKSHTGLRYLKRFTASVHWRTGVDGDGTQAAEAACYVCSILCLTARNGGEEWYRRMPQSFFFADVPIAHYPINSNRCAVCPVAHVGLVAWSGSSEWKKEEKAFLLSIISKGHRAND